MLNFPFRILSNLYNVTSVLDAQTNKQMLDAIDSYSSVGTEDDGQVKFYLVLSHLSQVIQSLPISDGLRENRQSQDCTVANRSTASLRLWHQRERLQNIHQWHNKRERGPPLKALQQPCQDLQLRPNHIQSSIAWPLILVDRPRN